MGGLVHACVMHTTYSEEEEYKGREKFFKLYILLKKVKTREISLILAHLRNGTIPFYRMLNCDNDKEYRNE